MGPNHCLYVEDKGGLLLLGRSSGNSSASSNNCLGIFIRQFCIYCMVYYSFYMPHGLEVDANDNIWITDVALHQVTAGVSCDVDHHTLLL